MSLTFEGVVLTGGASRRMGRDKALIPLADGRPLARVAADALLAGGATRVRAIGGEGRLAPAGLTVVADRYPGEGPLGGLLTALATAREALIVVLTCDLPAISGVEVKALAQAMAGQPQATVTAALRGGRPQFLTACYRSSALATLQAAFDGGERSVRGAVEALTLVEVAGLDEFRLGDADTPEALADLLGRIL